MLSRAPAPAGPSCRGRIVARGSVDDVVEQASAPDLVSAFSRLITAAYNGEARMLEMLLEAGADPSAIDATGKGPLVYAAGRGYARMVKRLLEVGIDPARAYGNDLTALMWAAGHSNDVPEAEGLATVEALLAAGAPVGPADNRGRARQQGQDRRRPRRDRRGQGGGGAMIHRRRPLVSSVRRGRPAFRAWICLPTRKHVFR